MDKLPKLQLGQLVVIDPLPLAVQDRLPLQVAALGVHHFLYVLPQFLGHRVDRRTLAVPLVDGPNVPDNTPICPPAGRRSCGGGGGRQRDHICPLPHRGAGGGAGAQRTDTEAGLAGIGGRRTAPAGASGLWGAE